MKSRISLSLPEVSAKTEKENIMHSTPAVSYTHLDVYKRQIYDKINYIAYSATTQEELCYGEKGAYEEGYFSRERELKRQMVRLFRCV